MFKLDNFSLVARVLLIFFFGVVLPLLFMYGTYTQTTEVIAKLLKTELISPERIMATSKGFNKEYNDYMMYSWSQAQLVNQTVVMAKLHIRAAIISIGLSSMSIGVMFVVVGINDGGGNLSVGGRGVSFSLITNSTGAIVFTIGAMMAAVSGLYPIRLSTGSLPAFNVATPSLRSEIARKPHISIEDMKQGCANYYLDEYKDCYIQFLEAGLKEVEQ
ncbi:hypothetical protein [Chromobacterium sp.]|uniref:hypothetical protein n=1 Tax=Chromobacterium sp. TaxID=306190 RepID=UPI0035B02B73